MIARTRKQPTEIANTNYTAWGFTPEPVRRELLLISRPAEGRRLSWQLAKGCSNRRHGGKRKWEKGKRRECFE